MTKRKPDKTGQEPTIQAATKRDKQAMALPLLLTMSRTEVAAAIGVSRQTVSEWLAEPAFRKQLDDLIADHVEGTRSKLEHSASLAVETLEKAMQRVDDEHGAGPAVRAALAVLDRHKSFGPITAKVEHSGEVKGAYREMSTAELLRMAEEAKRVLKDMEGKKT